MCSFHTILQSLRRPCLAIPILSIAAPFISIPLRESRANHHPTQRHPEFSFIRCYQQMNAKLAILPMPSLPFVVGRRRGRLPKSYQLGALFQESITFCRIGGPSCCSTSLHIEPTGPASYGWRTTAGSKSWKIFGRLIE
jgi:hypothetical protein